MFWVLKNRLIETVLLSTNNICFGLEIRKLNFRYSILTKVLVTIMSFIYFFYLFFRLNCEKGIEKGGSFAAYYKGNNRNIKKV